jgi:hypothetical protein
MIVLGLLSTIIILNNYDLIIHMAKRGLFIVFEGIDRVGKTTQCKMLQKWFTVVKQEPASLMSFPGMYF